MKPENAATKAKKSTIKRTFFSVPNLKELLKIKPADVLLPGVARKTIKDKPKTAKQSKKVKETSKLPPPVKTKQEQEEKNIEDYQYMIKKNIVNMMVAGKKKTTKQDTKVDVKKSETKNKSATKKTREVDTKKRAATANPVKKSRLKSVPPTQHSEYVWQKGIPTMILHPKVREAKPEVPKLENIFDVFKDPPKVISKAKGDKIKENVKSNKKKIPEKVNKPVKKTEEKKKPKKKTERVVEPQ